MYNNEYEEYMRSVLGYQLPHEENTYEHSNSANSYFPYRYDNTSSIVNTNNDYAKLYPEIYKILKPMIVKACDNFRYTNKSFSSDILEELTNEIYTNIESDEDLNVVNLNVTTVEADYLKRNNSETTAKKMEKDGSKSSIVNSNSRESATNKKELNNYNDGEAESRKCCGNPTLKDLIKILLINQLINENQVKPPRPPYPPKPFPTRPPFRDYEESTIYNDNINLLNNNFRYYN